MSEWILQYEDGESIRQKLNSLKNAIDYLFTGSTAYNMYLSGLTDVVVEDLNDGDMLIYSASTRTWYNTGYTNVSSIDMVFAPNAGLRYHLNTKSGETIYNTLLDPALVAPLTIGGVLSGTTVASLSSKTLVDIIDEILFQTVLPTYTLPTITLSYNVLPVYEVGATISPILTLTSVKNDAGIFTYLSIIKNYNNSGYTILGSTSTPTVATASNIEPQFGYNDPNNPNYSYTFILTDLNLIIPATFSTSPSSIIYGGTSIYNNGLVKKNNKGVYDDRLYDIRNINNPQSGSTTLEPSNLVINGWYPYFYGKSITSVTPSQVVDIIQSGSGFTKVVENSDGNLTMSFNAVGEWCWFAIFSEFQTKTTWYETGLNTGNIGDVTDLFSSPTILSINSPDGYWNNIDFKIYVCQKVTTIGICQIY